jgi:hypothetical protein
MWHKDESVTAILKVVTLVLEDLAPYLCLYLDNETSYLVHKVEYIPPFSIHLSQHVLVTETDL